MRVVTCAHRVAQIRTQNHTPGLIHRVTERLHSITSTETQSKRWFSHGHSAHSAVRSVALSTNHSHHAAVGCPRVHRGVGRSQRRSASQSSSQATDSHGAVIVTTPIFYVNAAPHIGHMYSAVLADAIARWEEMKGSTVLLSTGTDEHGLKVFEAAERAGVAPSDYCTDVSSSFQCLFDRSGVTYHDYIRTTDQRHIDVVQEVWNRLNAGGFIYKGEYTGWYCVSDEEFLTGTQVIPADDGSGMISAMSGNSVIEMTEENYMFKLSLFADRLLQWMDENPTAIQPANRVESVRSFLNDGVPDLSVSRQRAKQPWGIEVPGDSSHTIYVWLDALVNYMTIGGFPSVREPQMHTHIVGKDILKFHAVYWPAILMALDLPLPNRIIAHGHWTIGKRKMSKSTGNVVDPGEMMDKYGVDGFRYFLLSEGRISADADFSEDKVEAVLNELANTLGNLHLRCTSKRMCPGGTAPSATEPDCLIDADSAMIERVSEGIDRITTFYNAGNFSRGLHEVMLMLHAANQYFDHAKPWVLAKTASTDLEIAQRLASTVYISLEAVRVGAVALLPVCPETAKGLLLRLGCSKHATASDLVFGGLNGGCLAQDRTPAFPKFGEVKR